MTTALSDESRDLLCSVTAATLTTCLFKRGLRNVWLKGVAPVRLGLPRMVGEAFTLRFIPAREDLDGPQAYAREDNIHRRAIEECPKGQVLVIDTHGEQRSCTNGDLLVQRLKFRGCAGIVTDGGFRDSSEVAALGYPAYHTGPALPASFSRLHAAELNVPIGCAGVPVYPGDVIVGDAEGVVVIPTHLVDEVAIDAYEMSRYDQFASEQISAGRSIFGLYPSDETSRREFASWRPRDV
jgi:regulator of RNase E activity RraA